MAGNRRAKGQRVYTLSRGQLASLAVGFAVTSLVIFFLGILIGQGIEERKLLTREGEEPVAKIPIRKSSALKSAPVESEQEMTFYDTLTQSPSRMEGEATGSDKEDKTKKREAKLPGKKRDAKGGTAPGVLSQGRVWSVQVNAFTRESDARNLANRLKNKGYDTHIGSAKNQGQVWHRVLVGQLPTRDKAKSLLQALKKKEQFTKAIITRGR